MTESDTQMVWIMVLVVLLAAGVSLAAVFAALRGSKGNRANIPAHLRARLLELIATGHQVKAIKELHQQTGMEIGAAKRAVERMAKEAHAQPGHAAASASTPAATGLPADLQDKVKRLLASNRKIEAIKEVQVRTGMGLKECKDLVEAIDDGRAQAAILGEPTPALSSDVEREVRRLLASGSTITAVKYVRDKTGLGLKEAKELVEAMAR